MAGPLGVTHLLLFSRTETGAYMRIARTPRGPTLHFRIHSYSLTKDIKKHQKAPKESVNDFLNPPLVRTYDNISHALARSKWLRSSQGRGTTSRTESAHFD